MIYVLALIATATTPAYQHCVTTKTGTGCFIEVIKDKQIIIATTPMHLQHLMDVPFIDAFEAQRELLDKRMYEQLIGEIRGQYDYDLTRLPDGELDITGWGEDVGIDELEIDILEWAESFLNGGPEISAVELAHKHMEGLLTHEPDGSKCDYAILWGAVAGASKGASVGGFAGSALPGVGTLAGGTFGAGWGFVAGAIHASETSPYCEHDDHDHVSDKEDEKKEEDEKKDEKKEEDEKKPASTTTDAELNQTGPTRPPETWDDTADHYGDPDVTEGQAGSVNQGELVGGDGVIDADDSPEALTLQVTKEQLLLDPDIPDSVVATRLHLEVH